MRVYIAGPYTQGDKRRNVNLACHAADQLHPSLVWFVPHLSHFHDVASEVERTWDDWMDWCLAWLEQCDVVLRLPGESRGADVEVQRARELGMHVYHSVAELNAAAEAS